MRRNAFAHKPCAQRVNLWGVDLGGMSSLEQVELYECKGVTHAGLVFLAGLPRLREVHLDGLPGVTLEGTRVFPAGVRVKYST